MSSWAPTYLTYEECKQIEADSFRELGMDPPTFQQRRDPAWQEAFFKKMDAWVKANPDKLWGLERMIEEDRKRGEQLRAKAKDKA